MVNGPFVSVFRRLIVCLVNSSASVFVLKQVLGNCLATCDGVGCRMVIMMLR